MYFTVGTLLDAKEAAEARAHFLDQERRGLMDRLGATRTELEDVRADAQAKDVRIKNLEDTVRALDGTVKLMDVRLDDQARAHELQFQALKRLVEHGHGNVVDAINYNIDTNARTSPQ
jgi:Tfp pilus assembly protein PilN